MAEIIDVYLPDDDFNKSADGMNKKLEGLEAQAEKVAASFTRAAAAATSATDQATKKIEIITSQTSRTTQTRGIQAAQRQLDQSRLELAGPLDRFERARLDFERDISGKFAGNNKFIEQRTEIYKQQLQVLGQLTLKEQQAAAEEERLQRAVRASRNTSGADAFREAENLVNQRIKTRQGILSSLAYETASPLERIGLRRDKTISELQAAKAPAAEIERAIKQFKDLENVALASSKNIGARIAEFITSPTYAARKSLGDFLQDFGKFGIIAGGALIGIGAAAATAFAFVRGAGKAAEEVVNLGTRLGVTAGEAAVLSAQARIAGVGVDSLGGLVRKLSTDLADGSNESRQTILALEKIGVTVGASGSKFRDPISILRDFSKQLDALPDHARKVELLTKAFGRGAVELLPLIENFAELEKQARKTGVGLDNDLYKQMAKVDDELDTLGISWDRLRLKLSVAIVGVVKIVKEFTPGEDDADIAKRSAELNKQYAGIGTHAVERLKPELTRALSIIKGFGADAAKAAQDIESNAVKSIVDRFRSRVSLEGLQQQIQDLQELRNKELVNINYGNDQKSVLASVQRVAGFENAIKDKQEQVKSITEFSTALETAHNKLIDSQKKELVGLGGLVQAYRTDREELLKKAQAVGETIAGSQRLRTALSELDQGFRNLYTKQAREDLEKFGKALQELDAASKKATGEANLRQQKEEEAFNNLIFTNRIAQTKSGYDIQEQLAAGARERELRGVELLTAKTLQEKLNQEQKKSEIEVRYLGISQRLRQAGLEADTALARQQYEQEAKDKARILEIEAVQRFRQSKESIEQNPALTINPQETDQATIAAKQQARDLFLSQARQRYFDESAQNELNTQRDLDEKLLTLGIKYNDDRLKNSIATDEAIRKSQEDAQIRSLQLIQDANTRVFDTFKQESAGIFDAMLTKSQNIFQAIGNAFKNIILTSVKDVLSTQVARQLTQLTTGQPVGLQQAVPGVGLTGRIAEFLHLGAKPTFPNVEAQLKQISKLEQPGHLGDALLRGNAVPVTVVNPEAIQQKVELATPTVPPAPAAATSSPLAATLALFASLSGSLQPLSAGVQDTLVQSKLTGYSLQQLSSQVQQRGTVQSQLAQEELSKIAFSAGDIRRIPVLPPPPPATLAKTELVQRASTLNIPSPLPVVVQNASDLQQKIDVNKSSTSQQVNQAITIGYGGGGGFAGGITRPPLNALLASLAASPQLVPSGFKTAGQSFATSATISYPELGVKESFAPSIRDQSFGFGGGGFGAGQALIGGGITGSSIQDIFSGSRNAFTGGSTGAMGGSVDALGIPVNQASEQLTALTSQIGLPGAQAVAASGGIKGLFSSLGGSFSKLFQKIGPKGFAAFGIPIGLGIEESAARQPYGAKSTAAAGLGGALAGFGVGAQFGVGIAGAEIGAGVSLLRSGLQTGGTTGFFKDVGGGALAGAAFGPIGIAVGAGVGALLGGLSLAGIIQTKNQKFHNKIKDIYHVDINDQKLLSQFSQIADQKYGGNVDVAVRSIEVRQIVQLWAQAHGQNSLGIVGTPQQSIFANQGGRLTQIPTYFNGQAVVPGDTRSTVGIPQLLPNGGYITVPAPGGANVTGGGSTILSLDADATTRVLQGQAAQVIQGQPRLISQQTSNGMGASSARRDIASSVLQPAFLTT